MTKDDDHKHDDAGLAAEYALGLLDGDQVTAFEARLADEPTLRRVVAQWQDSFVQLTEDIPHALPPAHLKARLLHRLFSEAEVPRPSLLDMVKDRMSGGLLAVFGGIAALLLVGIVALFLVQPGPSDSPLYVAEVVAEDDSLRLIAVVEAGGETLSLNRVSGTPAEGRDYELWLIAGAAPAVSLGVLPLDAQGSLTVPAALRAVIGDAVLAISDEPAGGSLTGQPTGAVLATGKVTTL